jgi:hypothetical protein
MDSQPRRSRAGPAAAVLVMLLLLVGYVLSIGPAVLLLRRTEPNPQLAQAMQVVYYPVIWLHEYTPLRGPLDAYVDFWEDL